MAKINTDSDKVSLTDLSSLSLEKFFCIDECSVDELQAIRNKANLDSELPKTVSSD